MSAVPSIRAFGDAGLLVTLDRDVSVRAARRARDLARSVEDLRAHDPRWGVAVAAAASVLVPFDPLALDRTEAAHALETLAAAVPPHPPAAADARTIVIPVSYGGDAGPDLADVAAESGLAERDVIDLHAGTEYEVLFLGFAPGFGYLGEVPAPIAVPRLATPRTRVPAGSVGIAGRVTGAYPAASPGGWRIVGRTDVRFFDPVTDPPALLRPGDRVRFDPT